jgi:hypothetical protein
MSDGTMGVVVGCDGDNPYCAWVKRLASDGKGLEKEIIKIGKQIAIKTMGGIAVEQFLPVPTSLGRQAA